MTKLIDETGIRRDLWDPDLLRIVGDSPGEEGCNLLSEAVALGCAKIEVRHWLYCLVKWPSSLLRRQLVDPTRQRPALFQCP